MGAAISLLVILTLASVVIRIASVTLRLTGLPDHVARFQARSAFTGAGFTTIESEAVVNYPIRRRVIGLLMTLGNVGLVSVLATLTVSFVSADAAQGAMAQQFLWLLGTVVLLWVVALNPVADRLMCISIGWLLRRTTKLAQSGPTKLLQMTRGYSIAEHRVLAGSRVDGTGLSALQLSEQGFVVLGIKSHDGGYVSQPAPAAKLTAGDVLVLYGDEDQQAALHDESFNAARSGLGA